MFSRIMQIIFILSYSSTAIDMYKYIKHDIIKFVCKREISSNLSSRQTRTV